MLAFAILKVYVIREKVWLNVSMPAQTYCILQDKLNSIKSRIFMQDKFQTYSILNVWVWRSINLLQRRHTFHQLLFGIPFVLLHPPAQPLQHFTGLGSKFSLSCRYNITPSYFCGFTASVPNWSPKAWTKQIMIWAWSISIWLWTKRRFATAFAIADLTHSSDEDWSSTTARFPGGGLRFVLHESFASDNICSGTNWGFSTWENITIPLLLLCFYNIF